MKRRAQRKAASSRSSSPRGRSRRPAAAHARGEAAGRLGKLLDAYLRDRARAEGCEYDLTPDFFVAGLLHGCTFFFGIEVCSHWKLVRDDQEPEPGYFAKWMTAHGHAHCNKNHPAPPQPTAGQLSEYWRAAADNFTDDALLAKWDMVGDRMAREEPERFMQVLRLFAAVREADVSAASKQRWRQLGRDLIKADRRTLAELAIGSHVFLASRTPEERVQ